MNSNIVKSAAMTRNYTRASFNSTGSGKKIVEEFRCNFGVDLDEPENDNREGLYPLEVDNIGIPPKTKRRPEV